MSMSGDSPPPVASGRRPWVLVVVILALGGIAWAWWSSHANAGRFRHQWDGTVKDKDTGLEWAQSDIAGFDWQGARQFCVSKGDGWRIPNRREIVDIYDPREVFDPESSAAEHCKAPDCVPSPLF